MTLPAYASGGRGGGRGGFNNQRGGGGQQGDRQQGGHGGDGGGKLKPNQITVYLISHMLKEGNGRKVYTFEDAGNHNLILKPPEEFILNYVLV